MRTFRLLALIASCTIVMAGCATSRDYQSAVPVFNDVKTDEQVQITDPEIAKAFEARPQLSLPADIAIFENAHPDHFYTFPNNEMADEIKAMLSDNPAFSNVKVLSPIFIKGPVSPRSVRLAAAYHKAPLTLLCDSDFRVRVSETPLVILNLTIIGAAIVPSTTVEVETRVGVHLMDTYNGYIYFSDSRTKSWRKFIPSGWGESAVRKHHESQVRESYNELIPEVKRSLSEQVKTAAALP